MVVVDVGGTVVVVVVDVGGTVVVVVVVVDVVGGGHGSTYRYSCVLSDL